MLDLRVPGLERLVDAVEQERAQRGVGRDVGQREPDACEDETPSSSRARNERRASNYSAASSMYPACLTVRISGGPSESSFRRR